jgi:hypothetical protein
VRIVTEQLPIAFQVPDSDEARMVERVLAEIAPRRGREAAITMHEISERTGLQTRLIQSIVKFLVEERHEPIGTATTRPFGYFVIQTEDERRAVRNHFVRRALSNLEHAKAYDTESIVGPLVGQIQEHFPEVSKP